MSKQSKKLLSEGHIKRMMQIAGIQNLAPKFLKENFQEEELNEEEKLETEGKSLSQTPIKKGGNKTMAQESFQQQENENLQEVMPDDEPGGEVPPAPSAPPPAPTGHAEPDGDEPMGGEPMVQDLVKAIADAITAQTGVAVDVQGAGGMPGDVPPAGPEDSPEPPVPEEKPESEVDERMGHRDHSGAHYSHGQPMEEGKKLNEDFSEAPKVTKQNQSNQGTVKDPYKSQVRVQGADKPESQGSNHYPHKMSQMESLLAQRVLERILEGLQKAKTVKENKVPTKSSGKK